MREAPSITNRVRAKPSGGSSFSPNGYRITLVGTVMCREIMRHLWVSCGQLGSNRQGAVLPLAQVILCRIGNDNGGCLEQFRFCQPVVLRDVEYVLNQRLYAVQAPSPFALFVVLVSSGCRAKPSKSTRCPQVVPGDETRPAFHPTSAVFCQTFSRPVLVRHG